MYRYGHAMQGGCRRRVTAGRSTAYRIRHMRTFLAKAALVLLGAVPVVVVLGAPASATDVLPCSIQVDIDWRPAGLLGASVYATTTGTCEGGAWTTCDVTLVGPGGPITSLRSVDIGSCSSSVSLNGVQAVPYFAVGRVGYSAENTPETATTRVVVPVPPPT